MHDSEDSIRISASLSRAQQKKTMNTLLKVGEFVGLYLVFTGAVFLFFLTIISIAERLK